MEEPSPLHVRLTEGLNWLAPFVQASFAVFSAAGQIDPGTVVVVRVTCNDIVVPTNVVKVAGELAVTFVTQDTGTVVIDVRDGQGRHASLSPLQCNCDARGVWGFGEGMLTRAGPPQIVSSFPELRVGHSVVDVAASSQHVLLLTSAGTVYVMGQLNMTGQLGVGDFEARSSLTPIPFAKQIKSVAARDGASLLLDVQGHVYSCGLAMQNGDRREHACTPVLPPGLETVKAKSVCFVGDTALCLATNGQVWEFGSFGRATAPFRARIAEPWRRAMPVRLLAGNLANRFAVSENGEIWHVRGSSAAVQCTPTLMLRGAIVDMKVMQGACVFLTDSGYAYENRVEIYTTGTYGNFVPCGWSAVAVEGPDPPVFVQISTGTHHCLLLDRLGRVYGYGASGVSQLVTTRHCVTGTPMHSDDCAGGWYVWWRRAISMRT